MPVTLKEITAYEQGARFYAADLHVHSYGASEDVGDPALTFERVIDCALKEDVAILCIADHNTARNVQPSLDYGAQYTGQMLVLPGVEVTTAHGHLLAFFPPEQSSRVQDLLSRIHIVGNPGARNSHTTMSMTDVIKEVERLEGIAIAAHIDRANTGFEAREDGYPAWKSDILSRPGLFGLEFDDAEHLTWYSPEDLESQRGAERRKILQTRRSVTTRARLAAVQNSDAHTLKALLERFAGKSLTRCVPSMTRDLEVRVLCVSRPRRALAKRKAMTAREWLKEARSKAASRRTGTGYKARWRRASGHLTAKLYRPKSHRVDPAAVR